MFVAPVVVIKKTSNTRVPCATTLLIAVTVPVLIVPTLITPFKVGRRLTVEFGTATNVLFGVVDWYRRALIVAFIPVRLTEVVVLK